MALMKQVTSLLTRFPGMHRNSRDRVGYFPERRVHRRLNARKGTRVLIIDDSDTAQFMITKMFTGSGYVALQSRDPDRGLRLAFSEHPDLVILDIGMPGMNGFEVLKRIRKDPLARQIPVIMISGNPKSINILRKRQIDADGFIKKPFTRSEIFTRVEKMLDPDRVPKRASALPTKLESTLLQRFRHRWNSPLMA